MKLLTIFFDEKMVLHDGSKVLIRPSMFIKNQYDYTGANKLSKFEKEYRKSILSSPIFKKEDREILNDKIIVERQEQHTNRTMKMVMVRETPYVYEEIIPLKLYPVHENLEYVIEYCDYCDGCGWYEGGKTLKTTCTDCNGTGEVCRLVDPEKLKRVEKFKEKYNPENLKDKLKIEFREKLITFLNENEDAILPMATPLVFDIMVFMEREGYEITKVKSKKTK